jgi:hypothetical protein
MEYEHEKVWRKSVAGLTNRPLAVSQVESVASVQRPLPSHMVSAWHTSYDQLAVTTTRGNTSGQLTFQLQAHGVSLDSS